MGYPVGPLLPVLAHRILHNLDIIESMAPKWGAPEQDRPPFSETQLLMSLLGVLVFPHERTPLALGEIMKGYKPLPHVLNIRYSRRGENQIEMTGSDGEAVIVDPARLSNLPKLLRNSLAHFNVLPMNKEGRFGGIRVWNRDLNRQITFIADVDFDELRPLARHVLKVLREQPSDLNLPDPEDPIVEIEAKHPEGLVSPIKPPGLNRDIWKRFLDAHDGNAEKAKIALDRLMMREANKLLAAIQ
jgi:HEPN pEK499 p136